MANTRDVALWYGMKTHALRTHDYKMMRRIVPCRLICTSLVLREKQNAINQSRTSSEAPFCSFVCTRRLDIGIPRLLPKIASPLTPSHFSVALNQSIARLLSCIFQSCFASTRATIFGIETLFKVPHMDPHESMHSVKRQRQLNATSLCQFTSGLEAVVYSACRQLGLWTGPYETPSEGSSCSTFPNGRKKSLVGLGIQYSCLLFPRV